jgi:hypothetical protein
MKRVPLWRSLGFIQIDERATYGATIGTNVYAADGELYQPVGAEIDARLAALEDAADAPITGPVSVQVKGALGSGGISLQLVGDSSLPGNTRYYGTDASGVKGWVSLAPPVMARISMRC